MLVALDFMMTEAALGNVDGDPPPRPDDAESLRDEIDEVHQSIAEMRSARR
jgi:hypothetical protein